MYIHLSMHYTVAIHSLSTLVLFVKNEKTVHFLGIMIDVAQKNITQFVSTIYYWMKGDFFTQRGGSTAQQLKCPDVGSIHGVV